MGWWSETIMGGDLPLDIEGDLVVQICGINFDDYLDYPPTKFKDIFNDKIVDMISYVELKYKNDEYCEDYYIAYQVLGVILMSAGSTIAHDLRDVIVKAAEKDGWAKENEVRKKYITDFISATRSYIDGEPVEITSEGLFQKLVEGMVRNKNG